MIKRIVHIILLVFLFSIQNAFSQKDVLGYKIEGDSIVFTFDKRDYSTLTHHYYQKKIDFENLDIRNVVVAGNFNNWSQDKWVMKQINEYVYQLKKRIIDFNDEYNYEFKFIINNALWAEPDDNISNITLAKTKYGNQLGTFNLRILPTKIVENGNAKFFLKGHKKAKQVILSGSFNKWNESIYKMKKTEDGWQLDLQLKPDEYQYKFIVDGKWITDPDNSNKVRNEFDGYNSILNIKKEVTFLLDDYKNAKEIILSGSFNNWATDKYKMKKTERGWSYKLKLSGGKHHYKFIVDGEWIVDPKNPVREFDGSGNINSVKMIK